jgi:hypothetical protein
MGTKMSANLNLFNSTISNKIFIFESKKWKIKGKSLKHIYF